MQRILRTRHECPGVVINYARETRVREDLMTLPGESWSWQQHAKEHLLHHCGHLRSLRKVIVMVAGALDEGRIEGFERQHAMLCQINGILESAAKDKLMTPIGKATPKVKSELPSDDDNLQQQIRVAVRQAF